VVGDGRGWWGANADVGEGTTSRSRLPDWFAVKLFVFHAKPDVPGRDWWPCSRDGVVGFDSANDVDGSEFLRLG
jgi:hypothetical protein